MINELYHHGVKGQKWGVRRYQNSDGSLTQQGIQRQRERRRAKNWYDTRDAVEKIYQTMTKEERDKLTYYEGDKPYSNEEESSRLMKRVLLKIGDEPMAFCDIWTDDETYDNVCIGVANTEQARNKGYGTQVANEAVKWYKRYADEGRELVWSARTDNQGSKKIAEKTGFEHVETNADKYGIDWDFYVYKKQNKK